MIQSYNFIKVRKRDGKSGKVWVTCNNLRWLPLTFSTDDAVSVNTWENILFRGEPPSSARRPDFFFVDASHD